MDYAQFCPVAKATQVLAERWTLLIVRELLAGRRRFSEIQRGLGDISPAVLTARLKSLERQGLVIRRKINGQRMHEYHPTDMCQALTPVIMAVGEWGLQWVRHTLREEDFDVDFLMHCLQHSVDPNKLPGDQTVIQFKFEDLCEHRNWWLLVSPTGVEPCTIRPASDVDVYFTTTVRVMHDVWMGDRSYSEAISSGDLILEGQPSLTRHVKNWLRPSIFVDCVRAPAPTFAQPVPAA